MAQQKEVQKDKTAQVLDSTDAVIGVTKFDDQGRFQDKEAMEADAERGDPLWIIAHEIFKVSRDGKQSAVQLRKAIVDNYPRSSKEESMRFLASMTRMLQAAEVAQRMASEIHGTILNQVS